MERHRAFVTDNSRLRRPHEGWRRIRWAVGTVTVVAATALIGTPAAGAAALATVPQTVPAVVGPAQLGTRLASFDSQMVTMVNAKRRAAGVPELKTASGLTSLAVWWSNRMADGATGGTLEHNPNAQTMLASYGAKNWRYWGENVAKFSNGASAAAVFDAYWHSPEHKANILGAAYRYIGMGTVAGSTATFNTMEFTANIDAPTSATAPSTAAASAPKPARLPAKMPVLATTGDAPARTTSAQPPSTQPPAVPPVDRMPRGTWLMRPV